jgi:hypothetical protein
MDGVDGGKGDGVINRCVMGSCRLHDKRRDHFRPGGWRLGESVLFVSSCCKNTSAELTRGWGVLEIARVRE